MQIWTTFFQNLARGQTLAMCTHSSSEILKAAIQERLTPFGGWAFDLDPLDPLHIWAADERSFLMDLIMFLQDLAPPVHSCAPSILGFVEEKPARKPARLRGRGEEAWKQHALLNAHEEMAVPAKTCQDKRCIPRWRKLVKPAKTYQKPARFGWGLDATHVAVKPRRARNWSDLFGWLDLDATTVFRPLRLIATCQDDGLTTRLGTPSLHLFTCQGSRK